MAVGEAGVAVAAAVVVIGAGLEAKLLAVKVKGPPKDPAVIFCRVSVAGLGVLVKVQMIFAFCFKFSAATVMTFPDKLPKLAGLPDTAAFVSVHEPVVKLKLALAASVNVTGLATLVTVVEAGVTGAAIPAVVVVIFAGVPARLVTVKLNGPPA